MQKRIFKTFLLGSLIVLAIAIVLTSAVISSYYLSDLKSELKTECKGISEIYNIGGLDKIKSFAKSYKNRITVVQKDGVVVFDNLYDESKMENHLDRFEIFSAIEYGEGEATRLSNTLAENSYYFAVRLLDGNVLRVSKQTASVFGMIGSSIPWLIFIFLIAFIVIAILSNQATKRIVKPINKLDLDEPLEADAYEELSPLLKRMNTQNQLIASQIKIIKDKQKEFDDVINNMKEGLLMIGSDGKIISMNKAAEDIFGKKNGESYLAVNRNSNFLNAIEQGMKGEENSVEFFIENKTYEIRLSPYQNADKTFSLVAIIMNIDEKLLAEKQRKEFSANVSHELKTPLTSIMGYAEIISNGIATGDDVKTFGQKIQSEAKRLYFLVQDILTISKLEEVKNGLPKENIEFKLLSEVAVKNLSEQAAKKNVSINILGDGFELTANRASCYQMVLNVIENAINYNKENGTIDIFVGTIDGKKTISVKDSGIGIDKKDIPRIFERFYRVDKSRSKNSGGTGLGLSIVKHTVMNLNGEIKVESQLNVGTKITIEL
ncbi:MAG: ATP-binding protein [Clostridia bacterium]